MQTTYLKTACMGSSYTPKRDVSVKMGSDVSDFQLNMHRRSRKPIDVSPNYFPSEATIISKHKILVDMGAKSGERNSLASQSLSDPHRLPDVSV